MTRDEKMIVALTGCSHALSHGYLLIFPAVLLLLQEEFSMGYLGLGIISNIMGFSYGLGALPGGMIYNRFGAKKLYLICFLGSAGASFLVAVSPNFFFFTAGLALLGALGSVYHPLANSLITSKVKEYGRGLGIHGAAGNIGLAAAPFIAALIGSKWGWRQAYIFFTIPGIALSLWSLFIDMSLKKEGQKESFGGSLKSTPTAKEGNFWLFFALPLVLLYLVNMLHSFNFHGAITFLPTYLAKHTSFQIFSWDSVALGGMLSGLALFMGVFGQYMGGVLGQKPRLERKLLVISALSLPFIFSMSFSKDSYLLIMALVYFFLNFSLQPMTNVLLARYTTLEMRGTAFGIFFFAAFGIGSLASSFSGYIAQNLGLPWVFVGLSFSTMFSIFCAFFLLRLKKQAYGPTF
ncbi:MAG: MFS transporter [Thermodesulfobacteriota bacterium]|nr:MFS transporter [Thermodesulfobacteriota bacterium]